MYMFELYVQRHVLLLGFGVRALDVITRLLA